MRLSGISVFGMMQPPKAIVFKFQVSAVLFLCILSYGFSAGTDLKEAVQSQTELLTPSDSKMPESGTYPVSLIGLLPSELLALTGPPSEIFPMRGEEAWQDDVVFYYDNHTYIFWFDNRVWQVRFDARFTGEVLGIRMGSTDGDVVKALGEPFKEMDGSYVYHLPSESFPIRLRLFFSGGRVSDIYIYRADF